MKVHFTALGCAKNLIDSEQMLALITDAGHTLVSDPAEAEAAVVNTCAFIESAQEEAINTILELAHFKTEGQLKRLVVTGCLAQRYQDEILQELPEIDAVVGTSSFAEIVDALESEERGLRRFADKSEPLPELDRAGHTSRSPTAATAAVPTASSRPSAGATAPVPSRTSSRRRSPSRKAA